MWDYFVLDRCASVDFFLFRESSKKDDSLLSRIAGYGSCCGPASSLTKGWRHTLVTKLVKRPVCPQVFHVPRFSVPRFSVRSSAPPGLNSSSFNPPTAYAVGCILPPLRGCKRGVNLSGPVAKSHAANVGRVCPAVELPHSSQHQA